MTTDETRELRLRVLRLAMDHNNGSVEYVVNAAKAFEEYVLGAATPEEVAPEVTVAPLTGIMPPIPGYAVHPDFRLPSLQIRQTTGVCTFSLPAVPDAANGLPVIADATLTSNPNDVSARISRMPNLGERLCG